MTYGLTLITKYVNPRTEKSNQKQLNAYSGGVEGNNGLLEGSKASNKDSLRCAYCKKPHTTRRGAGNSIVSPQILKILLGWQRVIKEERKDKHIWPW